MRIAVTGSSGFIGGAFLRRLSSMLSPRAGAAELVLLASSGESAARLSIDHPMARVGVRSADGNYHPALMSGVDHLFHLGWSSVPGTAAKDPAQDLRTNVEGGIRLLEAANKAGVGRVLFVSSGGTVYGATDDLPIREDHPTVPVSAYGAAKLCMEHYVGTMAAGRHLILRPGNVYGDVRERLKPQGVIEHWLWSVARNEPIELWNNTSVNRDMVHVDDMVEVLCRCVFSVPTVNVLNVGSGVGTSLAEVLAVVRSVTGVEPKVIERSNAYGAVPRNVLDTSLLESQLGFLPATELEERVAAMWAVIGKGRESDR